MTQRNIFFRLATVIAAALIGALAWWFAQTPSVSPLTHDAASMSGVTVSGETPATSASAPIAGQPSPGGAWAKLTPRQQAALAPLAQHWDSMGERQREKWVEIAKRYHQLSQKARERLHDRMADWVRMTPEQRQLARESYQNAKTLPPNQKAEAWEQYQRLSDEQKKTLAAEEQSRNRPSVVSAPPSGKTGVQNPYDAVHRKQNRPASARIDTTAPASASTASLATGVVGGPAAPPPASQPPAAAPPGNGTTDLNAPSVFNSELYRRN